MNNFQSFLKEIAALSGDLYHKDFLLTWEKSVDELRKIVAVADALQWLRRENIATRCFESGLAVSIFRDQSTRTRFSYFWTRAVRRSPTARPCARQPT
jgi:ornithine carbamoyltransferase